MVLAVPYKERRKPAPKPRKPGAGPSVMDLLHAHKRVEIVDDERDIGNGIIITLKAGWTFDPLMDNRVQGADTPSEALAMVRRARAFTGEQSN